MGQAWCEDCASFAEVTIAVARLQGMLQDLERRVPLPPPHASVAMVVLQDAHHTLGALVAAHQLRRIGVSVRLILGQDMPEIAQCIETAGFEAIFISATRHERLEALGRLVKYIRRRAKTAVPIVLGGTVLDQNLDIKRLTGVDHMCNDPKEAAKRCGLMQAFAGMAVGLQ